MTRVALIVLVLLSSPLSACLWDRETPARELPGPLQVEAVLAGRIQRNVAAFYELRLKRLTDVLQTRNDDVAAFDDAAVACDQLRRFDEAIAWMERKRFALESAKASLDDQTSREHWYRYRANLGTFHAHRWLAKGADRAQLGDLKLARDFIKAAIDANPWGAHRQERVQLLFLEWLLALKSVTPTDPFPNFLGLDQNLSTTPPDALQMRGIADSVESVCSFFVHDGGPQSVDLLYALALALTARDKQPLAGIAWLRLSEAIAAGGGSLVPGAPNGDQLRGRLVRPNGEPDVQADFQRLRQQAAAWAKARDDYMLARLSAGRHPDTDQQFWAQYTEKPFEPFGENERQEQQTSMLFILTTMGAALVVLAALGGFAVYVTRRHVGVPTVKDV